jgi:hypothetical protein
LVSETKNKPQPSRRSSPISINSATLAPRSRPNGVACLRHRNNSSSVILFPEKEAKSVVLLLKKKVFCSCGAYVAVFVATILPTNPYVKKKTITKSKLVAVEIFESGLFFLKKEPKTLPLRGFFGNYHSSMNEEHWKLINQ